MTLIDTPADLTAARLFAFEDAYYIRRASQLPAPRDLWIDANLRCVWVTLSDDTEADEWIDRLGAKRAVATGPFWADRNGWQWAIGTHLTPKIDAKVAS